MNSDTSPAAAGLALVSHNIAGLHADCDPNSELVSQVVSGCRVRLVERADGMALVEGEDRYRGWIRSRFLAEPADRGDYPATTIAALIADLHSSPTAESQLVTKLTVAAQVTLGRHSASREFVPVLLPGGETAYTHRANLSSTYLPAPTAERTVFGSSAKAHGHARQEIIRQIGAVAVGSALRLMGTPYLWGGTTPFGIDCSGLTQLAYRIAGLQLLRDASLQIADRRFGPVYAGIALADAVFEPGDLIFFKGSFPHVGLAIGDGSFVHAAGREIGVTTTPCDDPEWGAIYIGARRLLPNADLAVDRA